VDKVAVRLFPELEILVIAAFHIASFSLEVEEAALNARRRIDLIEGQAGEMQRLGVEQKLVDRVREIF
jgi:hypothetical protein